MDIQKNDTVELTIETLGYRGEGVARIDRVPVFIDGALPGERVRAIIILVKKNFCVGKLVSVIAPSPSRVAPECPVFGKCGGCDLQHLEYGKQLEHKRAQVADALKKIAGITAEVGACVPSDKVYAYRNKLSLPVRRSGGADRIGFYAEGSHRIVEIDACPLQSDRANSVLPLFAKWMEGQTAFDEEAGKGDIKHISIRETGAHMTVTVVATKRIDLSALDKSLVPLGNYALYLNINTKNNNVIFGDRTILVGGAAAVSELYRLKTEVHPLSFLQVNGGIAEKLYGAVSEKLRAADARRVLDAYSGGGMLSAMLARTADEVVGVEIVPEAVDSAIRLARDNSVGNVRFVLGDCATEVPKLAKENAFDAIVLDPPRHGCDEKVIAAVDACRASTLIYISCNPSTLARDLSRLTNYAITEITPYDFFPQTKHTETLCCLERK